MGIRAYLNALEKRLTLAYAGNGTLDRPARSPGNIMTTVSQFRVLQGGRDFVGLEPQLVQRRLLQSSLKSLSGGLRAGRRGVCHLPVTELHTDIRLTTDEKLG